MSRTLRPTRAQLAAQGAPVACRTHSCGAVATGGGRCRECREEAARAAPPSTGPTFATSETAYGRTVALDPPVRVF